MTINVYMGSGDTFTVSNSNESIHGAPGNQTVLIGTGVTGTTFDANVERIALAGNLASYTFQTVAGVGLQVMSGTTVVATIPSLNQTTTVAFGDGSAPLVQTGGAAYTLGGQAIATTAVNLTTAQLGTNFNSTDTSGITGGGGTTGGSYTLTSDVNTVTEGGNITFTVTRTNSTTAETLTYNAAGDTNGGVFATATPGTDFSPATGTVSFAIGETVKTFVINALNDAITEGLEGVKVTLLSSSLAALTSKVFAITDGPNVSFTLTTGQDIQTANIFNGDLSGTTPTLQGFDVLTGTAGRTDNTLKIVDGTAGHIDTLPAGLSLSNIQAITVTTSGNAGEDFNGGTTLAVFDTSAITGVTSITVSSTGVKGDNIKAATTTDVTDTYNGTAGAGAGNDDLILITGGNNVTVTDNGSYDGVTVTGAKGNVVVTEKASNANVATQAVNVQGGANVTVTTSATGAVNVATTTSATGAVTVTSNNKTTGAAVTVGSASTSAASTTVSETNATNGLITVWGGTGAVNVTQTGALYSTGDSVLVRSGGAVTVSTTGGFAAGGANQGIVVGSDIYRSAANAAIVPVTGAVSVTDSNSGANADDITVIGGTTVNITTTATSGTTNGINVGVPGVKADDATGNVTIVDQTALSNGKFYWGSAVTKVGVNGATAVSITGGGTGGAVTDDATTAALATVSLTSVANAQTLTGNAITTVNITNSGSKNAAGTAQAATSATVVNTTAAHTLNINLANDASGTTVTDDVASTFTIVQTGAASTIALASALGTKQTVNLSNTGTGTLTLGTDISTTLGATGNKIVVTGAGAVALGTQDAGTKLASIDASGSSGAVSATIAANYDATSVTAINFTGGSGPTTLTLDAGTTAGNGIKGQINGGSGTNNTLIFTNVAADYVYNTPLNGSLLTGFQNLVLKGTSIASGYYGGGYSSLAVDSLGNAQPTANAVTFSSVAAGTPLTFKAGSTTTATGTAGVVTPTGTTASQALSVLVNDVTVSVTTSGTVATDTNALRDAINAANILGVTAASTATTVTVTGADSLAMAGSNVDAATVTTPNVTTGGLTLTLAAAAQTATGNTLPLTIGTATAAAGVTGYLHEANNQTIAVTSVGTGNGTNTLTLTDGSSAAQANSATKITVAGAANLTLSYLVEDVTDSTSTSTLATIDASSSSGKVDVTHVQTAAAGETVTGGSGKLTVFGSGLGNGQTAAGERGAVDVINAGSGGAAVWIGYGGAGAGGGSETISLAASTAVSDTLNVGSAATYGDHATVSGFAAVGSAKADVITFVNANKSGSTAATFQNQTVVTDVTSAGTVGGDTYTIANGIITFTGSDTGNTLISDAEQIVNNTVGAAGGANHIAAFNVGSTTYVVGSGASGTTTTDVVLTLNGLGNVTGFANVAATGMGSTAAAGVIEIGTAATTLTQNTATDAGAGTTTTDAKGDAAANITSATGGTHTINNLGASGTITDSTSGQTIAALTVTQLGTSGGDSLTINHTTGAHTYTALNIAGDWAMTLNNTSGAASTVTTFNDTTNTLTSLTLAGSASEVIKTINATALTSITDNNTNTVTLGGTTALGQSNMTVAFATGSAAASSIKMTGNSNTVTDVVGITGLISDTGTGLKYTDTSGASHTANVTAGSGATITLDAANVAANTITVGANSTVVLGTTTSNDNGGSTITLSGATAGATSSGSFTMTTLTNAGDNKTHVVFATTDTAGAATHVNVGSVATLGAALDFAAMNSAGTTSGTTYADWFQFDGNTYVLEHTATGAASAMAATDTIIKITGLVTLTSIADTAGNLLL